MSQLLGRIVKQKQRLCFSDMRRFSTASPYVLCKQTYKKRSDGATAINITLHDPRKDETVKISDQTLPKELRDSMKVGASKGWVGMMNTEDYTMRLTNIYNPCASASSHKVITLPPLDDSVNSISLSAAPDQDDQDCVVAAKSNRPYVYLCRPGDSEWIHAEVPHYGTQMMYSARDGKFYLMHRINEAPVDLFKTSSGFPQVSLYQSFPNPYQFTSAFTNRYVVESPSGESFMVEWSCNELSNRESPAGCVSYSMEPKFRVFRQDPEQQIATYLEDIGDLCIFLGMSEAFCLCATDYPGLKPNSVYYAKYDTGLGSYHLSSNTLHQVTVPATLSPTFLWLAPFH